LEVSKIGPEVNELSLKKKKKFLKLLTNANFFGNSRNIF
jgi:hypothetical protein